MSRSTDVGEVFGMWCVVGLTKSPKVSGVFCNVVCECGSASTIRASYLRNGSSKSCGCNVNRTHGMSGTPEYRAWENARSRCNNSSNNKYPRYGGRGIKFCDKWSNSFEAFIADMGLRPSDAHSLDRKDNDADYSPDNCHWAMCVEQNNNRSSYNRRIKTSYGVLTVAEYSRLVGSSHATILSRLNSGMFYEEVFNV